MEKLNQTAIVIVEIEKEGKVLETRYVTIGIIGKCVNTTELGIDALEYLKSIKGIKAVKDVIVVDSNKYQEFLENNIISGLNKAL